MLTLHWLGWVHAEIMFDIFGRNLLTSEVLRASEVYLICSAAKAPIREDTFLEKLASIGPSTLDKEEP